MKTFTRHDLRQRLREGVVAPVYLLFGSETYLRNIAARTIADFALKGAGLRDFNESAFDFSVSDVATLLASAEQLPMMDSRRVINVTGLRVSANKNSDSIEEDDEDLLQSYLLNPSEKTVLILIADELDKRRKISKLLIKNSFAVEFPVLDRQELVGFATEQLSKLGGTAAGGVLRRLVDLVGNDLRKLTLEIQKLATAAMPDAKIDYELVEELVRDSHVISNFQLTDYLLSNNRNGAIRVMSKILDDGAEPLMILGLLSYNFHRLLLTKNLMDEGADRTEISKVVRLPFNKQKGFLEIARRTSGRKFSRIINRLAEVDLAIKTSVATPRMQIEMLVCELASL